MDLVKIKWFDITNENSWTDIDDLDKAIEKEAKSTCYSVGWLYKETEEYIVILPSKLINADKEISLVSYEIIPVGVIRERTVL